MSNILEDLKDFLVEAGAFQPSDCSLESMPDLPALQVTIYSYRGGTPRPQIASVHHSLQIAVRDDRVSNAINKAMEIYGHLRTEDGFLQLTPTRWAMIYLREPPFKLRVDKSGRTIYGFNLGVTTHE